MLKKYSIDIEPEAIEDIQKAINYYNNASQGLGKRFYKILDKQLLFLEINYFVCAIRYDDIRCMPIDNFPYLVHYRVLNSQNIVSIKAVFCTLENPEKIVQRIE